MSHSDPVFHPSLRVAQLVEAVTMGGAENLAVRIANARAQAGDASYLIVMTEPGVLSATIDPAVQVHYLHYRWPGTHSWPHMFVSLLRRYRRVAKLVRRNGIQIVQSHLPAANYTSLLLALTGQCATVATIHNHQEFRYGQGVRAPRVWARKLAYRLMLRRCRAVVTVSDSVRRAVASDLNLSPDRADRLFSIPNGVEIPAPLSAADRLRIRQQYGCGTNEIVVLAVGRLTEQKDYPTLIRAADRLKELRIGCRILVAGDGPMREDLERMIQQRNLADRFTLLGNVLNASRLMQTADIFALPSLWEGLPLSLLEAMAGRLPVVGTHIEGIADIVQDGVTGLLVPPQDHAALAEAIASLLSDPKRRAGMGAAGLEVVRRHYTLARVSERLSRLYRNLLSDRIAG